MKKNLLTISFFSLLCAPIYAQGECRCDELIAQQELSRVADEAAVVVYTVIMYKDITKKDSPEWRDIVSDTIKSIRTDATDDGSWIVDFCKNIVRANQDNSNVHGEVRMSIGNGQCPEGMCSDPCSCVKRYNGVCPCSAGQTSCCTE